jgi:hypothetical protein
MKLPKKIQSTLRKVTADKITRPLKPAQFTRAECVKRCGHIQSDGAYNQCIDYCMTGL